MLRKVGVVILFLLIASMPLTGYAAGDLSYFEGVWVGAWQGYQGTSHDQDVTIEIHKGNQEGVFKVKYSWGAVTTRSGEEIPPGSFNMKGMEEGDRFVFRWKNKQGRENTVTLRKNEESKVEARLEKSGPMESRPYREAILHRK